MFLLDTDILSALRKRGRHPEVVGWLEGQRTVDLHLSVVTVGEMFRARYLATGEIRLVLCAGPRPLA